MHGDSVIWGAVVIALVCMAAAAFLARRLSTLRSDREALLQRHSDRLLALAARMENIREEEKERIARVLHDTLGQELSAIKMNCAVLASRCKHDEAISAKIQAMRELVDTAMLTTRNISASLRPAMLDTLGLGAAIEWQVREFEKQYGISAAYKIDPIPMQVNGSISFALFRILQEALTNVARHSGATHVAVTLETVEHDVLLTVYDNGKGIAGDDDEKTDAYGILGMKGRAHSFGGTVTITRLTEKGTRVVTRIPGVVQ